MTERMMGDVLWNNRSSAAWLAKGEYYLYCVFDTILREGVNVAAMTGPVAVVSDIVLSAAIILFNKRLMKTFRSATPSR